VLPPSFRFCVLLLLFFHVLAQECEPDSLSTDWCAVIFVCLVGLFIVFVFFGHKNKKEARLVVVYLAQRVSNGVPLCLRTG